MLDNTSLAVSRVLKGTEREETRAFHAFRGAYPFHADFCAPGKGCEKGSVEGGVKYVRRLAFRPVPEASTLAGINAMLLAELEGDLDARRLPDRRTARQAWHGEREHLRPLPERAVETCRVLARVADKFGHVRLDGVAYSVPTTHAYRPVWAKVFHDRVAIACGEDVVAVHERSFREGASVLDPRHVLALLERKHRAVPEATALLQGKLPDVFHALRRALAPLTRKPDQEWVRVLRLLEDHPDEDVERAAEEALARGSPRLETVRMLLRTRAGTSPFAPRPAPVAREDLRTLVVSRPSLEAYDVLARRDP
ncbi:MAG: Mu transposase domain-containing protein [Planctomycetota bacterium]